SAGERAAVGVRSTGPTAGAAGPSAAHRTGRRAKAAKGTLRVFNALSRPLYWLYERRLVKAIRAGGRLPRHIGIIMDGNRRFARAVGLDSKAGHDHAAEKAREVRLEERRVGKERRSVWAT